MGLLTNTAFKNDFYPSGNIFSSIWNMADHSVTLTDPSLTKYATVHYPNGGLVPVRNGNLAAYGTLGAPISSESITLDYIMYIQPYPVVEWNGSRYMCINKVDKKDIMKSIQRKNAVYESSVVTDFASQTDDIAKAFYMEQNAPILQTPIFEYAELKLE